jgi:hypothetical protein
MTTEPERTPHTQDATTDAFPPLRVPLLDGTRRAALRPGTPPTRR